MCVCVCVCEQLDVIVCVCVCVYVCVELRRSDVRGWVVWENWESKGALANRTRWSERVKYITDATSDINTSIWNNHIPCNVWIELCDKAKANLW